MLTDPLLGNDLPVPRESELIGEVDLLGRTGVCLFAKRLEDGKFQWPSIGDRVVRLTAAEFAALLEVLDWRRVHTARMVRVPTASP